jgi:hypothetical protein
MTTASRFAILLIALGCASAPQAQAKDPDNLPGCISLGSSQQIARQGSADHFLLRNGDDYYQVSLTRNCSALPSASTGVIERNGAIHTLCQRGSKLRTNRGTCTIGKVEAIDAEAFNRPNRLS